MSFERAKKAGMKELSSKWNLIEDRNLRMPLVGVSMREVTPAFARDAVGSPTGAHITALGSLRHLTAAAPNEVVAGAVNEKPRPSEMHYEAPCAE